MRRKNLFGNMNIESCDFALYISIFAAVLSIVFAVVKANTNNFGASTAPVTGLDSFVWYSQPLTGPQPATPLDPKNYVTTSVPIETATFYRLQFTGSTNTPSSLVASGVIPGMFLRTYNASAGTYTNCKLYGDNKGAPTPEVVSYSGITSAIIPINVNTSSNIIYFQSGSTNSADVLVFGFDINNRADRTPVGTKSVFAEYTSNSGAFSTILNTQNGKISVTMKAISITKQNQSANYLVNDDYTFGGSLNTGFVFPTTLASILSGQIIGIAVATSSDVLNVTVPQIATALTNANISRYAEIAQNIQTYIPSGTSIAAQSYNTITIGSDGTLQLKNIGPGALYTVDTTPRADGVVFHSFNVSWTTGV